ncbi:MBL fold metallo-hydrolase [Geomonas sp. RF6]|uniref:MBL fold metallo-hydrolase n=1 Tax=Geomonas sp. RF6 TaxID=2897342 RepID=UPI001E4D639E|nr:MBL fold metallo-hydrolase [Geomonas sp. RF6]UFS71260.1 MBL fold metallo-hydrolase [Geomonas sp. RF6]
MIMEIVVVDPLGVNCVILGDEKTKVGAIVDPGGDASDILAAVERLGLTVKYIINTHGHFDHIGANAEVKEKTGAELLIHEGDFPMLTRASQWATQYGLSVQDSPHPTSYLTDGMKIEIGGLTVEVIHTPGHTPGGCSLYLKEEGIVITGDTLFADSVGRTDLPGGSHQTLIRSIREKLLVLPDDTTVWPGHGPSTTIGRERHGNPFLT